MPNIKVTSFEMAAEEAEQRDDEPMVLVELKDRQGESLEAALLVRQPTQGEFARLTLAMGRTNRIEALVPAFNHFLTRIIVEPEDATEIEELKDRTDIVGLDWLWDLVEDRELDFELMDMMNLVSNIMEQFTGFPTRSSSASTSRQSGRGNSSAGGTKRKGSTRSRSMPAVSQA